MGKVKGKQFISLVLFSFLFLAGFNALLAGDTLCSELQGMQGSLCDSAVCTHVILGQSPTSVGFPFCEVRTMIQ